MRLVLLTNFFCVIVSFVSAQATDTTKAPGYFGGSVTITNNGISLLPSFSLGRPAAIIEMNVGRRLTFDPQFRIALDGKPWSFVLWWRYKLINKGKFRLGVGGHPSIIFRERPVMLNGVTRDMIVGQRYLALELVPNYFIAKNVSVGLYYFGSHGIDPYTINRTDFITANANFSNIPVSKQFYFKFFPQVYYLRMDENEGYYVTSTITFCKRNFPLSIQSIVNKAIETEIQPDNDFLWNVSVIYSFGRQYRRVDVKI